MAMGTKDALVLVLALAMAATSSAVVYKVGDASGWTILGNVNYTDWAVKQTFHVGDVIEFKYPQGIHNVLEVKKADYDSCTNSTPIATHTSGDDKVTIKSPGHRFFICGVPGHCAAGQKLNVRVLKPRTRSSSPAPAPAPAASASAPAPAAASHGDADAGSSAATPPAAASTTTDGGSPATTAAPAPNANGAAGVSAGYPGVAAAVALAVAASMAMLQ